jgi:hypothetical protein
MRLRKDGKPDGRIGKAMARKPVNHPWSRPAITIGPARENAKKSDFKEKT